MIRITTTSMIHGNRQTRIWKKISDLHSKSKEKSSVFLVIENDLQWVAVMNHDHDAHYGL